jgi:hypothetical protein
MYVDAQVVTGNDLIGPFSCTTKDFVIRFNVKDPPSPAKGVVLLGIDSNSRKFSARIEDPWWRKKCVGCMALSPCWSSFGMLSKSPGGWTATVAPRAPGPDELKEDFEK